MAEQYDFTSIRDRILTNLSGKSEHQNVLGNSAIVNIIDALSEELEDEMMQDEYLTMENNWALAQNRSSLLTESKVHNYDVPRKRGATGIIKFGVSEDCTTAPSKVVDLPKWTQVSNDNKIPFTTVESATIQTTERCTEVECVQGEIVTFTSYANGDSYETLVINNDSVDNTYYDLYINDELWTKVDSLFDYSNTDKVYTLKSLVDFSGIKITFGNGNYGKMLANNDKIYLEYIQTLGSNGNVLLNNSITTVDSTIYNVDGDQVEVFCSNESSVVGGEDEASLEEIRETSPQIFQSGDRATSISDYEAIINSFSYIKKVSVTGAYEYNLDNGNDLWDYIPTEDNVLRVTALTTSDSALTEAQAIQLTRDIRAKNAPTDILSYSDIEIIPMKFNIDVAVNSRTYSLNQIKTNINEALDEEYSIDNMSFYQSVYNSDFVGLIDNLAGVRKHTTYITLLKDVVFGTAYSTSVQLPLYPIVGEDTKIYIKSVNDDDSEYELIGTSDSSGNITGEIGYTFSSLSKFNTSTGKGAIAITDGLFADFSNYTIRIEYRYDSDDIELTARNQLLSFNSSNFVGIDYYRSAI